MECAVDRVAWANRVNTHSGLRFTVETLSGGVSWTIYAGEE